MIRILSTKEGEGGCLGTWLEENVEGNSGFILFFHLVSISKGCQHWHSKTLRNYSNLNLSSLVNVIDFPAFLKKSWEL